MYFKIFFRLLLLLILNLGFFNSIFGKCTFPKSLEKAIEWIHDSKKDKYEAAASIISNYLQNPQTLHDTCLAKIYLEHGRVLARLNKSHKAIANYKKALSLRKNHFPIHHNDILIPYTYIGIRYYNLRGKNLFIAQIYLDSAYQLILLRQKSSLPIIYSYPQTCLYLGRANLELGDFDEARYFLDNAVNFYKKINNNSRRKELSLAYNDLTGLLGYYLKNPIEAINYSDLAFSVPEATTYDSIMMYINRAIAYEMLGNQHNDLQAYLESERLYQQALKRSYFTNNLFDISSILNSSGILFKKQGKYNMALENLNQAIQLNEADGIPEYLANNYHNLGWTLEGLQRDNEALEAYTKALQYSFSDFQPKNNFELPDLTQHFSYDKIGVLTTLAYKAKLLTLLSEKEPTNEKYLSAALATYEWIDKFIEIIRKDLVAEGSKFSLSETVKPIYEQAIQACQIWNIRSDNKKAIAEAFYYAERSKAISLFENMKAQQAARLWLPEESRRELFNLIRKRDFYEKELSLETLYSGDSTLIEENAKQLAFFKNEVQKKLTYLENTFPKYHQLKYKQQNVSLPYIKDSLLTIQTTLLEFFEGDSSIFIFSISQAKGLQVRQVKRTEEYATLITDLQQSLAKPKDFKKQKAASQFPVYVHRLFQILLKETLEDLPDEVNKLIIVPDGLLGYIPFDILLSKPYTTNQSPAYLLKDYSISYANSATLLKEQTKTKIHKSKFLFAGFAPKYETTQIAEKDTLGSNLLAMLVRDGNYKLDGAVTEVEKITALLNGQAYLGFDATEHNFKVLSPDYKILHLAMHSLVDDQNPLFSKLLFTQNSADSLEDNSLNAIELYNLNLNAELVVLSACNTGYGKLSRGEGIMSLSRAFSYAGVPSTVMSLWKVPDQPTAQIMVEFYKNLKKGQTKDVALRGAKLNWLDNTSAHEFKHPYYWAGFIASGDMKSLSLNTNNYLYLWVGVGLLLLIIFFFLRNRQS